MRAETEGLPLELRKRSWELVQREKQQWFNAAAYAQRPEVEVGDSVWWLNPDRPGKKFGKDAGPFVVTRLIGRYRLKVKSVETEIEKENKLEDVKQAIVE